MAKIQHAGRDSDKAIRLAVAAFLGNRTGNLTTFAECGREVTFFLAFRPVDDVTHPSTV
jgi:hypothetical protein